MSISRYLLGFPQSFYVVTFVCAALASALSLPLWRKWCIYAGVVDDPGHRKIHDEPIPLAGGLASLTGMVLPLVAAYLVLQLNLLDADVVEKLRKGFSVRSAQLISIMFGAIGMTFIGWLDDKHELRPSTKFAGQVAMAMLVAVAGVRIKVIPYLYVSYPLTILWILTVTNAFNFMDNMNGLCAGISWICALCFGFAAAMNGYYLVASISFLVAGAAFGFLPHNFPRAKAFLGDSGSHLFGFTLAVLAIMPNFEAEAPYSLRSVAVPLLVLAVPLGDLVWVVIIRWQAGKPFWIGDNNHLSHRFVRNGLSRVRAVALIWLLTAMVAAVAFLFKY